MLVYLLPAIVGVIIGALAKKEFDDRDIAQIGLGMFVAVIVSGIVALTLQVITVQTLIGGNIGIWLASLGFAAMVITPIIVGLISLVLYILVAFLTAVVVRMR